MILIAITTAAFDAIAGSRRIFVDNPPATIDPAIARASARTRR
jgi:hypothetical protein